MLAVSDEVLGSGRVWSFRSLSLGNSSYVIESDSSAVIVDPNRNIDEILALVHGRGLKVMGVLETHVHNDYLSGGFALAEELGVSYLLPKSSGIEFQHENYAEGKAVAVGAFSLVPVETPGHTWEHHSFVLNATDSSGEQAVAAFTGGSWLAGGAGRSDLLGPSDSRDLAGLQWDSIHLLKDLLSPSSRIMPTHGRGSYCLESDARSVEKPTVADELATNPVFLQSREEWRNMAGQNSKPIPGYFPLMAPANRLGPPRFVAYQPPEVEFDQILKSAVASEVRLVDVRPTADALKAPVPEAIRLDYSAASFTTWFGWIVPVDKPVYLVADSNETVRAVIETLAQIGREHIAGWTAVPNSWVAPRRFDIHQAVTPDMCGRVGAIVDLRHPNERKTGHLKGSLGIPLELLGETMPSSLGSPLLLHCAAGFRSAAATSWVASFYPEASIEVLVGPFEASSAGAENVCFLERCGAVCEGEKSNSVH